MIRIEWAKKTSKFLSELPENVQETILSRVEKAQQAPEHYLSRMVGQRTFKLRAGDYRMFLERSENGKYRILAISHRKNAYDF